MAGTSKPTPLKLQSKKSARGRLLKSLYCGERVTHCSHGGKETSLPCCGTWNGFKFRPFCKAIQVIFIVFVGLDFAAFFQPKRDLETAVADLVDFSPATPTSSPSPPSHVKVKSKTSNVNVI